MDPWLGLGATNQGQGQGEDDCGWRGRHPPPRLPQNTITATTLFLIWLRCQVSPASKYVHYFTYANHGGAKRSPGFKQQ